MRQRFSVLRVLVGASILLAPAVASGQRVASRGVPPLDHVFLIVMENHGLDRIIGDSTPAPYLTKLSRSANVARQYFAVGHPSLPNYLEIVGGSNFGIGGDLTPDWHGRLHDSSLVAPLAGGGTDISTPAMFTGAAGGRDILPAHYAATTIADQLAAAGKSWRSYQEDLPATGADGVDFSDGIYSNLSGALADSVSWLYAVKHDPFAYFASVQEGKSATHSLRNIVGFDGLRGLYADLRAGGVPTLSFIVPDQCHDMHGLRGAGFFCARDSTLVQMGDRTVERLVDAIEGSPAWKSGHDVIIITWDENDSAVRPNRVPFILITNYGVAGTASDVPYNHFSLLRTLESAFGLPCLNHACDADVKLMADLFARPR